jgi:hypothetical protein
MRKTVVEGMFEERWSVASGETGKVVVDVWKW